jgi:hypothetical protein
MPIVVATSGRPLACASAGARPVNGGSSEGAATTSAAASAAGISAQ